MTKTPFYLSPEACRQLLEMSREKNAKRRVERELRESLRGFTDSAYAELAEIHMELEQS